VLTCVATLVTPETLLRWYRELVARKYDGSRHRRAGRPPTKAEVAALVLEMARENPTWGYTRIRGALHNLGHALARSTIQSILADAGLEPAPERRRRGSWAAFLKAQWGVVAATDFFSVEVLTWAGLVRHHVFFVIDLKTRAVVIAGITHDLHQAWVVQAARGLLDAVDGFLKDARFLIHDRDPVFGKAFTGLLRSGGVSSVTLPSRSPNLNAYAERFVGSIRRECLSRVIPLGERHLRVLVAEYVEHYNLERNHQGVGNRLLGPALAAPANDVVGGGGVRRRERLGGLLSFYHREAA
jgi:transposase InsO family protein